MKEEDLAEYDMFAVQMRGLDGGYEKLPRDAVN
jgi:hypothetical protein